MELMSAIDADMDYAKALFDVNVFGTMRMCRTFANLVIAARGLVVNVSSIITAFSVPFSSSYSASKSAVMAYSRALRTELQPLGARVMIVMMGLVDTLIMDGDGNRRDLPPDSLYRPALDVFDSFRQFPPAIPKACRDRYAAGLAAAALRGPGWLGGRIGGTPNWLWLGGGQRLCRVCMVLPWWCSDTVTALVYKTARLGRLSLEAKHKTR